MLPKTGGRPLLILGSKSVKFHHCMSKENGVILWKSYFHRQTNRHRNRKVKVKFVLLKLAPFRHDNAVTLWYFKRRVDHDQRRPSIDFKVKGQIWTSNFVPFLHNSISHRQTIMILHTSWSWSKEDPYWFEVKEVNGQGHFRTLHCFHTITLLSFDVWLWYLAHVLPVTRGTPLLIWGLSSRSDLVFELCIISAQ